MYYRNAVKSNMSEKNKEKTSFVDIKERNLEERKKRAIARGIPQPPKKERTLIDVWENTNKILKNYIFDRKRN